MSICRIDVFASVLLQVTLHTGLGEREFKDALFRLIMSEHLMKNFHFMTLLFVGLGWGVGAGAESLVLDAPSQSDDGSFVLRITDSNHQELGAGATQQKLEVYRNKDGGEFRRILVGPRFSALSELVRENGVYGYKVRRVNKASDSSVRSSAPNSSGFSEPVYVKVSTNVPRMVAPRTDRLVTQLEPSARAIN